MKHTEDLLRTDEDKRSLLESHMAFYKLLGRYMKNVKERCKEAREDPHTIANQLFTSFPKIPDRLLFPGINQLKEKDSSSNTDSKRGAHTVFIVKPVEKSMRIFSSKDKPFMVRFNCSDGVIRGLIFKLVSNSAQESIMASVLANAVALGAFAQSRPTSDYFLGLHKDISLYNIQPLAPDILVLEVVHEVETIGEFIKRDFSTRSSSEQSAKEREVVELHKNFFQIMYGGCDCIDWFRRKMMVNYTYGFWWMIGAVFGVGDRNLRNIMIGKEKGLLFIDFEIMLGLGRNLPIPETVKMRLGPLFSALPGTLRLKELFKSVMVSYYQWLKENSKEFLLQFYELLCHRGEPAFSAKGEFYNEKTMKEHLVDFFAQADPDDYEQITIMMERETDPNAQKHMFHGWEPHL